MALSSVSRKRQAVAGWLQQQKRHRVFPRSQCGLCAPSILQEKEAAIAFNYSWWGTWQAGGAEEEPQQSAFPISEGKTLSSQRLLLHTLWGSLCEGTGSLCLFNQKRISFRNRNKTEPVQCCVHVEVRKPTTQKKLEKCQWIHLQEACMQQVAVPLLFHDIWVHLAFIFCLFLNWNKIFSVYLT